MPDTIRLPYQRPYSSTAIAAGAASRSAMPSSQACVLFEDIVHLPVQSHACCMTGRIMLTRADNDHRPSSKWTKPSPVAQSPVFREHRTPGESYARLYLFVGDFSFRLDLGHAGACCRGHAGCLQGGPAQRPALPCRALRLPCCIAKGPAGARGPSAATELRCQA